MATDLYGSIHNVNLVFAGHVDHGKSTLIGRILMDTLSVSEGKIKEIEIASARAGHDFEPGFIVDSFNEERTQGMTIDTTQLTFWDGQRQYTIIDVPGHVEFMQNMITGATQADAALLIVDASKGIEEQTRRHARMLALLGIDQVIAVINKMDLVDYSPDVFDSLQKEVYFDLLMPLDIMGLRTIPVSALTGENVTTLSSKMLWNTGYHLLECLQLLKGKEPLVRGRFVMPVQDTYDLNLLPVVVGTVASGTVALQDTIKITPSGQITRVDYLKKPATSKNKRLAAAGESVGLALSGDIEIPRGCVLCSPAEVVSPSVLTALVFWMDKVPYAFGDQLRLRYATHEVPCRLVDITVIDYESHHGSGNALALQNLDIGKVTIVTDKPTMLKPFDYMPILGRFVLLRDDTICAGGIVKKLGGVHGQSDYNWT